MLNKTERHNRWRCLQIGAKIVKGPLALFPPVQVDDYGWMECDFRIIKYAADDKVQESVSIYTDDTMNREEGFLPPIIRSCSWARGDDIDGKNKWPSIMVGLGDISSIDSASEILRNLQRSLSKIKFGILGVSLSRDMAKVECNHKKDRFDIFIRNGIQAIEYSSCSIHDDEYTKLVFESYEKLLNLLVPNHEIGWKERYEYNLDENCPTDMWEWQYNA